MEDEMTLDELVDALTDLSDDELAELRVAIDEEMLAREEPGEFDEDEDEDDEE